MNEEMMALGRRAVACKGWRWMPGMEFDLHGAGHLSGGWRIQSVQMRALERWSTPVKTITAGPCEFIIAPRGGMHVKYVDQVGETMPLNPLVATMLPVLEDPATLGCLLALVREAWGEPTMHVRWNAGVGRWDVVARYSFPACAKTEAEALVAALEAAP